MDIYRPVRTNNKTQSFGESKACVLAHADGTLVLPYVTTVKYAGGRCPSGYVSLYEALGAKGHAGEDYKTYNREAIYFDIDAKDVDGNPMKWEAIATWSASGGYGVLIRSLKPIPLDECPDMPGASINLVQTQYIRNGGAVHLMRYYGHMSEPTHLKHRQVIKFGAVVGTAGMSGATTGVHVHRHLLVCGSNEQGPFFYLDGDSDYKGRINEEEWFINEFAWDKAPYTARFMATLKRLGYKTTR